jgi:hypothetical protein
MTRTVDGSRQVTATIRLTRAPDLKTMRLVIAVTPAVVTRNVGR